MILVDTNSQYALCGFGIEGRSTLNFLLHHGVPADHITICDHQPYDIGQLRGCAGHFGQDAFEHLDRFDQIWKTPGIPPGVLDCQPDRLRSQYQFFLDHCPSHILAVTGSKGKSTTCTVLHRMLVQAGLTAHLAGNVGIPFLDVLEACRPGDRVVCEVSSYMLTDAPRPRADIAILLNLFPVHLDRHGDFPSYAASKKKIWIDAGWKLGGSMLRSLPFFADESDVDFFGESTDCGWRDGWFWFQGKQILAGESMRLYGSHQFPNLSFCFAIADRLGIPFSYVCDVLTSFTGLDHRLQEVSRYDGRIYIDDSIATTPESAINAIESFPNLGCIILGGQRRGYENVTDLVSLIMRRHIPVVLMGDFGRAIVHHFGHDYCLYQTDLMQEAIRFARTHAPVGSVILLSPATPSFGIRKDFKHRGRDFAYRANHP
ncbi:MAG: UDP-N-acetylmuramoyl-L-alanine--D-glutamate ligase [Candidatus Absconditabacterales bacterium]|nr:UDP-N-acetylmuramoyl-L-alanine--D-glutamate ligase [Candidatus Absconditabacterales bacterium]